MSLHKMNLPLSEQLSFHISFLLDLISVELVLLAVCSHLWLLHWVLPAPTASVPSQAPVSPGASLGRQTTCIKGKTWPYILS